MTILACMASGEIFDETFHGWKENWTKQEELSRKRLVLNPTIQQLVINLHIKYEQSSSHCCFEIIDEHFILQSMERKKI